MIKLIKSIWNYFFKRKQIVENIATSDETKAFNSEYKNKFLAKKRYRKCPKIF